ncbi:hypothetical protein M514_22903 [Trichuris suis]|uniref:Uncharacterized protein n=1 Tax=Trichuris suis TaxID=68888 RepID=A0A085N5X9_9BILA|nr:hypothetical protein M514_22903 [Trichuris suis]
MDLLKEECKETITGVVYFLVCIYVSMQEVPRCRGIYEIVFGRMKCRMFLYEKLCIVSSVAVQPCCCSELSIHEMADVVDLFDGTVYRRMIEQVSISKSKPPRSTF